MLNRNNSGTQILGASAVVGVSGKPLRIFVVHIVSGASQGKLELMDQTAVTKYYAYLGIANTGTTFETNPNGIFFPSGCYASFDANVTRCVVSYNQC